MSQAAVFVTHRRHPRILEHFHRLQREAGELLPVFLAVDTRQPWTRTLPIREPHLKYDPALFDALFHVRVRLPPLRYQSTLNTELLRMLLILDPELAEFEHIWLVEYDIDFSGHWGRFFSSAMPIEGDVLGMRIGRRIASPTWMHWPFFRCPPSVPLESQIYGLFQIGRFSMRFFQSFVAAMQDPQWQGIWEALVPTIALVKGYDVVDLGSGAFGDPGREPLYDPREIRVKNPRLSYFGEAPEDFPVPDRLYHPVKVPMNASAQRPSAAKQSLPSA